VAQLNLNADEKPGAQALSGLARAFLYEGRGRCRTRDNPA